MYWIIWLCFALVLLTIELITIDLVAVWFALSSLIMVIITAIFPKLELMWQLVIFITLSTTLLLSTRKLVKKLMQKRNGNETNLELILNHNAIVIEEINNDLSLGAVRINGIIWNARSLDGNVITDGALVSVVKIDGNKLIVEKINNQEGNI
ncbi:MAG: NfeD family protein [Clostridia bacterium]|nr:NfeD family protein [Clostridia bacterium]